MYTTTPLRTRLRCEDVPSIRLSDVSYRGELKVGLKTTTRWRKYGAECFRLSLVVEKYSVGLTYEYEVPGSSEWQSRFEHVGFVSSPQHFGGERRWFACPGCGANSAVLFARSSFRCRSCWGLAYSSQTESDWARQISRAQKMRLHLSGSPNLLEPFPDKPVGMHWRTYENMRNRCEELEMAGITGMRRKLIR